MEVQDTLEGEFREMRCKEEDKEGAQRIAQSGLGPNLEIIAEENVVEQSLLRGLGLAFCKAVKEA